MITLPTKAKVQCSDGAAGISTHVIFKSGDQRRTNLVVKSIHPPFSEYIVPLDQVEETANGLIRLKCTQKELTAMEPFECEQYISTKVPEFTQNPDKSEEACLDSGAVIPLRRSSEGYRLNRNLDRRNKMDKMIVVVFDSEKNAYEASKALQELQNEGSINLYAKAVIAKGADGIVEVKEERDMGPVGTAVGLLTGSLIGLIGGPVGLAVGAYAGTMGGMLYDVANIGISSDFLDEVKNSLELGKAAVVAEVGEEWTMPLDNRMEALGGVVFRRTREDVLDTQIERDIVALEAELDALKAEQNQATGEARAKLQAKMDKTKAKLQTKQDQIKARIETSQKETEAKIKSLSDRATKETAEQMAQREASIVELYASQKRRSELLHQAWDLTKKALSS